MYFIKLSHCGIPIVWKVYAIPCLSVHYFVLCVAECQEMFTQFDKNRDGLLDISDLGPLLRSMGPSYNPSEKELEELKEWFLPPG